MRIALCCKEQLFGQALTSLLSHEGNFDVVASESKPRECIAAAKERHAQVIVVDAGGLEKHDLEFLLGARAYGDFGVALVTGEPENSAPQGVDTVYARSMDSTGLIKAIREVGNAFVRTPSGRVRESRGGYGNKFELSRREFEVASLVAKGYPNRKISETVGLKEQSVKNLVSVIMRKLHCDNRVQVALRLSAARILDES